MLVKNLTLYPILIICIVTADTIENFDFTGIKACMKAIHPVNEEPYEVILDNHGCSDGPKTGRLRALDNVSLSHV